MSKYDLIRCCIRTAQLAGKRNPERGAAYAELLLLTVPLCLLSMVISSKLAMTSQTKVRAQISSSLVAQRGAMTACGGNGSLSAPWMNQMPGQPGGPRVDGSVTNIPSLLARISSAGALVSDLKVGMSGLRSSIEANQTEFPIDILSQSQLTATNWSSSSTTMSPDTYHFKPLADKIMPELSPDLRASSAFVCNEADLAAMDNAGKLGRLSPEEMIRLQLTAWAFAEAQKFF